MYGNLCRDLALLLGIIGQNIVLNEVGLPGTPFKMVQPEDPQDLVFLYSEDSFWGVRWEAGYLSAPNSTTLYASNFQSTKPLGL